MDIITRDNPLLDVSGLRVRRRAFFDGKPLVECCCKRDGEPARFWNYEPGTDERREWWMWLVGEMCLCRGVGYVCAQCLGARWTIQNFRAAPCPECATLEHCANVPQAWLRDLFAETKIRKSKGEE